MKGKWQHLMSAVSVWDDEKVLEMFDGFGSITL